MSGADFHPRDKALVRWMAARPQFPTHIATTLATLLASAVASPRPHHGRFGHRSTAFRTIALARHVLSAPP